MRKFFKLSGLFGGKKQKQQQQAKPLPPVSDTARSVAYGNVVEILCSGGNYGIEGLLTSSNIRESIYLEETPLSKDGTDFFKGITVAERTGELYQSPLNGFGDALISENSVEAEIKPGLPITRAFNNDTVTAIGIRYSVVINKNKIQNGQVVQVIGDSIRFKVYIKQGSSPFNEVEDIIVSGKFSEPFEQTKTYFVNPNGTENNFIIRLERVTPSDTEDEKRSLVWKSYSEVVEDRISFKRIAHVGIRFNVEEFGSSFPERRYHIGGMFLDIPTNAVEQSDRGLQYSGAWNGLFKPSNIAVADVSALIWYILTDEIDGVGNEIEPSMVDRYSLFDISKYNNEMIPNGRGGTERRHLCNLVLNKQSDGWKIIDDLLSSCHARKYWQNGILYFTQDRPERVFAIVNNADIIGDFDYSGTEITDRATAVNVTWVDLENFGKTVPEYVSDPTYIAEIGYNLKNLECVGCTRRSQAIRYARAVIYSENEEYEIVTFAARQRLATLPIGKVIAVCDYLRSDVRLGGFVKSATNLSIELDFPVTINATTGFDELFYILYYPDVREFIRTTGATAWEHWVTYGQSQGRISNGYLLLVVLPNQLLEFRRVINNPGDTLNLVVDTPFSQIPAQYTSWVLFTPEYKHKLWRVLSKDISDENIDIINITCTEYKEFKWEKVERNIEINDEQNKQIPPNAKPPTNFGFEYSVNGNFLDVDIYWRRPENSLVIRYRVAYKFAGVWKEFDSLNENYFLSNMQPGTYEFLIASVSYDGQLSTPLSSGDVTISFNFNWKRKITEEDLQRAYNFNASNLKYSGLIDGF